VSSEYRAKCAAATAVYVASIFLGGCFSVSVIARQDPTYAPTKADPVFVTVGVHSSIQDRQMLPLVMREFQAEGFNLTNFDNAKWVVVVGRDDLTIVTGATSTSVGIGGGLVGVSTTTTHEYTEKLGAIVLSLSKESVTRGDPIEVWQGKITAGPDLIKDNPKTVIRALIDHYGKDFEDDFRLRGNKESTY
jgi:hypothetical protein